MKIVERAVEKAVLEEFEELERLGGVLAATDLRYQRSQIQTAAHRYERQINDGTRPIIGLNRYRSDVADAEVPIVRTSRKKQRLQADRLEKFKRRHRRKAGPALDRLASVVEKGGNIFAELITTVEHCSLGQITGRLHEVVGRYRPAI